jgi:hypothetical protein
MRKTRHFMQILIQQPCERIFIKSKHQMRKQFDI